MGHQAPHHLGQQHDHQRDQERVEGLEADGPEDDTEDETGGGCGDEADAEAGV